jgi:hypothetical protein
MRSQFALMPRARFLMSIIDLHVAPRSRETSRIVSNSCGHEILKRLSGVLSRELVMHVVPAAAIMAKFLMRSTGRFRNVRPGRSPNSSGALDDEDADAGAL